ncbi:MAG TPA: hypothetical protein VEH48_00515, partial [Candidatus Nitrosopolaris sp.]|nr:hypothetical protein [Candidatus Nitrosopolaris sp.]
TLTDFEDNTIKDTAEEDWTQDGDDYEPPKADTAEYAAGLIFKCIQTGAAEIYAHEWMKDQDEGRA